MFGMVFTATAQNTISGTVTNANTGDPLIGAGYSIGVGENGESLRLGFNIFNVGDSSEVTEGNPRALNQIEEGFFFG